MIGQGAGDAVEYEPATPGAQSRPGLVIFRFDAPIFYANASRFSDDVKAVVDGATPPVRWLVLDCSAFSDVDYSAGLELKDLISYVHQHDARFGLARADDAVLATLRTYGVLDEVPPERVFEGLEDVFAAYKALPPADPAPVTTA